MTIRDLSKNVFLFGAGASNELGIPLLRNFFRAMDKIARGGQANASEEDKRLLKRAMEVGSRFESYHTRARFGSKDIEQILSMLSVETIAKPRETRTDLYASAIARTIELNCAIHEDEPRIQSRGRVDSFKPNEYSNLWSGLIKDRKSGMSIRLPTIITLNYDLVVERSFLGLFNRTLGSAADSYQKVNMLGIDYGLYDSAANFDVRWVDYHRPKSGRGIETHINDNSAQAPDFIQLQLYKLHGSLNFQSVRNRPVLNQRNITTCADKPFIVPPTFNKSLLGPPMRRVWAKALIALREARTLTVVGYSLPESDTYMKYFLKTTLGGNKDLDLLTVFDPTLFGKGGDALRARYRSCFSDEIFHEITFMPPSRAGDLEFDTRVGPEWQREPGTFSHFVDTVTQTPDDLLRTY